MTRLKTRPSPSRLQWQLEQQGLPSLLARIYAARGVKSKSELDYELKSLLPPARLTHADAAALNEEGEAESATPPAAQTPFVRGDKVGRNDPCPCGSGKKYKKCCANE